MAKFSAKKMGKEVGAAAVYAKPHTMSGGPVSEKAAVVKAGNGVDEIKMSVGGVFKSQNDVYGALCSQIRGNLRT